MGAAKRRRIERNRMTYFIGFAGELDVGMRKTRSFSLTGKGGDCSTQRDERAWKHLRNWTTSDGATQGRKK